MTTDHCIQIAAIVTNSITAFAVVAFGARINQSTPRIETAKQTKKTWIDRFFSIPFWVYFLFIAAEALLLLYDFETHTPISLSSIFWIAAEVNAIAMWLVFMCLIRLANGMRGIYEELDKRINEIPPQDT
jgi:hypothetical protein